MIERNYDSKDKARERERRRTRLQTRWIEGFFFSRLAFQETGNRQLSRHKYSENQIQEKKRRKQNKTKNT